MNVSQIPNSSGDACIKSNSIREMYVARETQKSK